METKARWSSNSRKECRTSIVFAHNARRPRQRVSPVTAKDWVRRFDRRGGVAVIGHDQPLDVAAGFAR